MGILKRISDALTDPHPERDETHAATRYAMMQPELVPDLPEPQETIEQRFNTFVRENPQVTAELVRLALYYKRHRVRAGMKKLFEDLRTNPAIITKDGKPYKLNNDYSAYYARHLMETVPELRGYFELRHQSPKTRKVPA